MPIRREMKLRGARSTPRECRAGQRMLGGNSHARAHAQTVALHQQELDLETLDGLTKFSEQALG